jgi:cell division protein FtsW
MYRFDAERTGRIPGGAPIFNGSVLLLAGIGMVTLYSSSYAFAERFFNNSYYFVFRQLLFGAGGLALFFIASRIRLELVRKLTGPLVALAALLCVLTFIPGVGVERLGASRWIRIASYTYQPSEMVKFALPLYLAHIFDKKQDSLNNFRSGILPPVMVTVLFFLLIYGQNNFSTAAFILVNALVIFFLAGVGFRYFIGAALIFLPLSAFMILSREHRVRRFVSFIKPEWDPLGAGYQVRSSLLTIMSGGFWGKGAGQGTRKLSSVPEIQSDFIFSAFAEEAGFIGVLLCFALFAVFAVQGYRGAWRSGPVFKRLLAAGMVTMIVSQSLLNIAVVSGSVPATGIPLPFFSAGGSSLATTLISAGLVLNVIRQGRQSSGGRGGTRFSGQDDTGEEQDVR